MYIQKLSAEQNKLNGSILNIRKRTSSTTCTVYSNNTRGNVKCALHGVAEQVALSRVR